MKRYTVAELQQMRESEDHVEFKKGEYGNVSYNGSGKERPKDRRKCILGYVTALCNEGGGRMVIGMHDKHPHQITGTKQPEKAELPIVVTLFGIVIEVRPVQLSKA